MEARKSIAINDGLHLPEPIIQHIQSFLTAKETALTAVISKSWYKSWQTRPKIDFDERDFEKYNEFSQYQISFDNYMEKFIHRFRELKVTPERLKLCMIVGGAGSEDRDLVQKALTLGAPDLEIQIHPPFSSYILPVEVFESKHLVNLSAVGCRIGESFGDKDMFSRITSIKFRRVYLKESEFGGLVKKCPLLESLFLCDCEGFKKLEVSKIEGIKKLTVVYHNNIPLNAGEPFVEFIEGQRGLLRSQSALFLSKFHHLTCLYLERVNIGRRLFQDFSSIFPCLEELMVRYCMGGRIFKISSKSLKRINLASAVPLKLRLDIPNILQFKFSGSSIPSLSLKTQSREWACDLELSCWATIDASWSLELKCFLTELKLSKICLSINLFRGTILGNVPDTEYFPVPFVHNLTIKAHTSHPVCPNLLQHLCWSVRPRVITCDLFPTSYNNLAMTPELLRWKANNDLARLLCEKFKKLESLTYLNVGEKFFLRRRQVVRRVKAEAYDNSLMKWSHLPWLTLKGFLRMSEKENRIRIKITWGDPETTLPLYGEPYEKREFRRRLIEILDLV